MIGPRNPLSFPTSTASYLHPNNKYDLKCPRLDSISRDCRDHGMRGDGPDVLPAFSQGHLRSGLHRQGYVGMRR